MAVSSVAAPAKKPVAKPAATPVEKSSVKEVKPAAKSPTSVVVDDFEREALTGWLWKTREWRMQQDGTRAMEETTDDQLVVKLSQDKKLVAKGKQGLEITYTPATESPDKEAIVVLRDSTVLMDERDVVKFSMAVPAGKGSMIIQLIDDRNTSRYASQQPVMCDSKASKTVVLDRAHFGIPEKAPEDHWKHIKRIQFVLHGKMTLGLDHIEFAPSPKK